MSLSSDVLVEIFRFAIHDLYDWSKFQRVCKQWHACGRIPRAMASVMVSLDELPKLGMPLCSMIRSIELVLTKAEDMRKTTDLSILKALPAFDTLFVNGRDGLKWPVFTS
jgi:hypothetical protein